MAVVGSLIVMMGVDNRPLMAGLLAGESALKRYGANQASTAQLAAASVAGIGLVAVAGMALAARAAADFQEQMAKVNTIAGLTPPALADIGSQVRALSVQTGVGLPDLTSSLYDLLSVGVPIGQAMEVLGNATTLSIGGLSTGKEAVDAITTSINAWSGATGAAKLQMSDSAKVTDLWAQGIKVGGFTAADIGSALSNVAAQASQFNTPLEQVVATAALLTTRGFTASTALTSMDAAFTALQRVPPGMEKLQKSTGKSYEQIARTQGIHEAITQVVADAQKFGIGLVDVFGRTDALGYVINTTGQSAQAYGDILASMYDVSGVAAAQADERMGTLDRQMQILGASVNDLGITLGTALVPPLTSFVGSVNGAVQGVSAWATANPQLSGTILPLVAGLGALAAAALVLPPIFSAAAAGIMLALSPVTLTLASILATLALIGAAEGAGGRSPDTPAKLEAARQMGHWGAGYVPPIPGGGGALVGPRGPGTLLGGALVGPRGPAPTTIVLNHTTVNQLDGREIGRSVETTLYNDASVYSSGFASDERPRH